MRLLAGCFTRAATENRMSAANHIELTRSLEDCHGQNGVRSLPADPAFYAPQDHGSPAPVKAYECRVRLSREGLSVTSPRTGRTLVVAEDAAPVALRRKVIHAAGNARRTATLTADELRAFANAATPKLLPAPTSVAVAVTRTPLHGGWIRPRRSRRSA
jgi:hypothetical protein